MSVFRFERLDSDQDPLRADIRPTGGIPATALAQYPGRCARIRISRKVSSRGLPRSFSLAANGSVTGLLGIPRLSGDLAGPPQCLDPTNNTNCAVEYVPDYRTLQGRLRQARFRPPTSAHHRCQAISGVRFVNRELESIGNQIAASGGATPQHLQTN